MLRYTVSKCHVLNKQIIQGERINEKENRNDFVR